MTSRQTAEKCVEIISRWITVGAEVELLTELSQVDGNKSFRDSVQLMLQIAKERRDDRLP